MGGYPHHAGSVDSRWEFVDFTDGLGRKCRARMPKIGAKFGALVVLETEGRGNNGRAWCGCDCGRKTYQEIRALFRGKAVRCKVCADAEKGEKARKFPDLFPDPSLSSLWLHRYAGILSRCHNPNCKTYCNYGARGIFMHEPWRADRRVFFQYVQTIPGWDDLGLDIDRVDNDKGYEPGNIRFVTRKENSRNRRTTAFVEYQGKNVPFMEFWETYCPEWASYNSIAHHLRKGRTGDEIVKIYRAARGL